MSRIFLVRHGEAVGDEGEDPGLSDIGRSQVTALAHRLEDEGIEAVWHGPKLRARQTGQVLGEQLVVDCWSTPLLDDLTPVPSARFRDAYSRRRLDWFDGVPEGERDMDGVGLTAAWAELRTRAASGSVVMVTHSFVISQFVALALNARADSWMRLPVSNAGLSIVDADAQGDLMVRASNETAHIRR